MDPNSRLTHSLLVVNTILIAFVVYLFISLRAELGGLKEVVTTKADLQAVQNGKTQLSFYQEACTRCHTEQRFTGLHATKDELMQIVNRMRAQPDARISEAEADKIHASLMLFKCQQCHSGEMMKKLSLMSHEQRLRVIEEMAKRPESQIPIEEAKDILKSWEFLLGF